MFKKIFAFFKGLFTAKATAEMIVRAAAARAFSKRAGMAEKVYSILNPVLDGPLFIGTTVEQLKAALAIKIQGSKMLPEEKEIINVLVREVMNQVPDMKDIPGVQDTGFALDYLKWVREVAQVYAQKG